jgi:hypothetical protein
MLTTTAFAACFQFVVWTVSCLYDLPVQSLHLPNTAIWAWLGITTLQAAQASPNLSSSTCQQS